MSTPPPPARPCASPGAAQTPLLMPLGGRKVVGWLSDDTLTHQFRAGEEGQSVPLGCQPGTHCQLLTPLGLTSFGARAQPGSLTEDPLLPLPEAHVPAAQNMVLHRALPGQCWNWQEAPTVEQWPSWIPGTSKPAVGAGCGTRWGGMGHLGAGTGRHFRGGPDSSCTHRISSPLWNISPPLSCLGVTQNGWHLYKEIHRCLMAYVEVKKIPPICLQVNSPPPR